MNLPLNTSANTSDPVAQARYNMIEQQIRPWNVLDADVLDLLAVLYVLLRLFYIMMYVSNMPTARSAVWAGAFMVNVAILFVGYR